MDIGTKHSATGLSSTNPAVNHDPTLEEVIQSAGLEANDRTMDEQSGTNQSHRAGSVLENAPEGKYKLCREIARGGMGIVMEAEDLKLTRSVAMKVILNPRTASRQRVLRFIEEARITSQLQHPGIMPIYEIDVDGNGNVFYTMKHVTGRTLKDILKDLRDGNKQTETDYPLNRLLIILQRVCDAVAYAHAKDVIHRDLKPENIMIGDYGEVLLMDWGLAKVLKRRTGSSFQDNSYKTEIKTSSDISSVMPLEDTGMDWADTPLVTMEGNAIGTPGYMAPEQARGQVSRMDEKSDIYSLGAILYHILALAPPIRSDNTTSRSELLEKISSGRIDPLKETSRAPKALIVVTMKALSLRPKDRYPTVKKFQADLDAYLGGFATSAEGLSVIKLITLFIWRHKVVSVATALILALLGVAFSINLRERLNAERAETAMRTEKNRAELALSNLKATAPALAALSNTHLEKREMDDALRIISNAVELAPENPVYHNKRGNILQTMLRFKEAAEEYGKVLQLAPGEINANENLEICRTIEAEPQKLFLALRKQNRLHEAVQVIMPLTKKPLTLSIFLKGILEKEKTRLRSFDVDSQGKCSIELEPETSDLSPLKAFPITELTMSRCEKLSDLSPLAGMPLTSLTMTFTQVRDLTPLKGIALTSLTLWFNQNISDLSPLKGMPLTYLSLKDCGNVSDLSPLEGTKLTDLNIQFTKAKHLTPLQGMPLKMLEMPYTSISDLTPLRGMPLTSLNIRNNTVIRDLSPLAGLPIADLGIDIPLLTSQKEVILGLKSLQKINDTPVAEFWKKMETK